MIRLYNGYQEEFPRKTSRFDILRALANKIRVSPERFKYLTLSSKSSSSRSYCPYAYCLPYARKGVDSLSRGSFHLRLVEPLMHLEDLSRECPETFNYLWHQTINDFVTTCDLTSSSNRDIAVAIVSCKLTELGLREPAVSAMEFVISCLGFTICPGICLEEINSLRGCRTQDCLTTKLDIIRLIRQLSDWPPFLFLCKVESKTVTVHVGRNEIRFGENDAFSLSDIEKVSFSLKQCEAYIVREVCGKPVSLYLEFGSKKQLESFLTVLDMAYKILCPGDQILDFKLTYDLNSDSLLYHDPNFVGHPAQDGDGLPSLFNFSLVEEDLMVMSIQDKKEAESVLRTRGYTSKFLVSRNFLITEVQKNVYQYQFFFLVGEIFHMRPIVVKGGRYKIDEHPGYLSFSQLFSKIEIMNKKDDAMQNLKLKSNYVTSEDIARISQIPQVYSTKGEATLSPLCVAISVFPVSINYLYNTHLGILHCPNLPCKPVEVTHLSVSNASEDFGCFVTSHLIDQIKGILAKNLTHRNVADVLGVYRSEHLPFIVEERFGVPLDTHVKRGHSSNSELFDLGRQLACGLLYLHSNKIVHGFPALHNCNIEEGVVKVRFVGILPALARRKDVYTALSSRDAQCGKFGHPARWLHRSMIFANAKWTIEVDR